MPDMRLSVVVMYHPSRTESAMAIADHCAELEPRLVCDPDPDGPPSPLRTAKRAWAACPPDATHHLVLQDDVILVPDFANHLKAAVQQHPDHGLVFYVNRNSPRNSYLFRWAAASGARWAPLSQYEYTPTLGLLLPAAAARDLAAHLATVPDDTRDDDEAVTVFCRNQNIPIVAVVPSLVDHRDLPSIAGNESHGPRHTTAFAGHAGVDSRYWSGGLANRAWQGLPFTVEMCDSRCLIRFARPFSAEPVETLFGWYWHDWCGLLGISSERILETWAERPRGPSALPDPATALEFWAAGYILGRDVATAGPASPAPVSGVLQASIESWVDSGLDPGRPLDARTRAELVRICLAAFRTAWAECQDEHRVTVPTDLSDGQARGHGPHAEPWPAIARQPARASDPFGPAGLPTVW
jgi:hypothetical protein